MANIDLFLDGVALTNGNILQNLVRVDSITGEGRLVHRVLDGVTGASLGEVTFPDVEIPEGAGPSFILPFGDGGFGVLASFSSAVAPVFQAFDAAGGVLGAPIEIGADDPLNLPLISIQSLTRAEDGTASLVTQTRIDDPSDPLALETETFSELRVFNLDGTISDPVRLDSTLPGPGGLTLPDGRIVTFSAEPGVNRPAVIASVLDPVADTVETGRTSTRSTITSGLNEYELTVIKQVFLPGTDRFAVVWSQVPNNNIIEGSIFFAFGRTGQPEARLGPLTQLAPGEVISDNFEILALPDGSLIIGWTQDLNTGQEGSLFDGADVVWQRFDAFGNPLSEITQVETAGPNESSISLELLSDQLLVNTAIFDDIGDGTTLASQTFDLALSAFTETADMFTGTEDDELLDGLGGDDDISAGGGNDTVIGGAGNDTLRGEEGDDTLIGSAGSDGLFGGAGRDQASYASATTRVAADLQGLTAGLNDAAGDTFDGVEDLLGGRSNDILRGDALGNILQGGNGADRLFGRAGGDTLLGEAGNDILYGNTGADEMSGGAGNDRFVYFRPGDSGTGRAARDVITDFNADGSDRIEIGRFDADLGRGGNQAFNFIGGAAFTGASAELRTFQNATLNLTVIEGDLDGDRQADFQIELTGLITLDAGDFTL